ncbi:MAG: hypothetical protein V5B32_07880 [Candidatus Accumulibacter sp. UW26]|jgi:hypothetical protein
MNRHTDSIVLAERQVAEARTTVLAEYAAARANLRRRMASPLFLGGAFLAAAVLGYLCRRHSRSQARTVVLQASDGASPQLLRSARALLRLW